ncbi:MAG: hypothetical protein GX357_01635 [Firmicutes bacterium]|nr:hypothetical protein [Bacillota bacterium]
MFKLQTLTNKIVAGFSSIFIGFCLIVFSLNLLAGLPGAIFSKTKIFFLKPVLIAGVIVLRMGFTYLYLVLNRDQESKTTVKNEQKPKTQSDLHTGSFV